jgi:growth factor-regulated tyrosine kinase substrate
MDKDRAQSPERSKHRSSHSRSDSHLRKELRRSQRAGGDTADDDLQRAIALSLAEAQANANGYTDRPGYVPAARSEPPLAEYADGEEDAELRAAIEASLREAQAPRASAPAPVEPVAETPRWTAPRLPQYDLDPREEDAILSFNQAVEQASAGGQIAPQAADMYERASVLRPKLVRSLDDTGRKERECECFPIGLMLMPKL